MTRRKNHPSVHPSRAPLGERLWSRVLVADDGCWNFIGRLNKAGRGVLGIGGVKRRAHQVAWLLSHFTIPDGLHVLHRCDNPRCCNPDHLFLGTHADNMRDRALKGRYGSGGLSPALVLEMRRAAAAGEKYRSIAERLGSRASTVWAAVNKNWRGI